MKFQGDILNYYDFIQVFVFTTNHHLNPVIDFVYGRKCPRKLVQVRNIIWLNQRLYTGNTLEGDVSDVIALDQLTSPFSPRKATRMSP